MKPPLCRTARECKKFFGRSLFLVGEFGVNDYHFSFQRKTVQELRSFVPDVVATISSAIERLITHGARSLVVPGVIPSGCSPPILTKFPNAPLAAYNSKTCCLTAQRAWAAPQLTTVGGTCQAPVQAPQRQDHLLRFLRPNHGDGGVASQIRF